VTRIAVLESQSRSNMPCEAIGLVRINAEHRIVYRVEGDLWIAQLRYHY